MDSDAGLLAAWRAGDDEQGRQLFQRYFQPLFRFFASKCDDPDELVQQTFLAIVKAKDQFAGRSTFRTYLYTVARNELFHHLRAHARDGDFDPLQSSIANLSSSIETKLARSVEHQQLCTLLRTLPVEMQTLLELHYWDGLDASDLAEVFDSNPAAIRNRLSRARDRLREVLLAADGPIRERAASMETMDSLVRAYR